MASFLVKDQQQLSILNEVSTGLLAPGT